MTKIDKKIKESVWLVMFILLIQMPVDMSGDLSRKKITKQITESHQKSLEAEKKILSVKKKILDLRRSEIKKLEKFIDQLTGSNKK